jgi:transposase
MDRESLLDDAQWELIEPLLPPQRSGRGRPMRDHRQVVEGVIYRYRCGIAWRDLPRSFGPWQTVWKRHRRFSADGTWDKILAAVVSWADAAGEVDWAVSVDSTINRAHQHATNLPRVQPGSSQTSPAGGGEMARRAGVDTSVGTVADLLASATRGGIELQRSARLCRPATA